MATGILPDENDDDSKNQTFDSWQQLQYGILKEGYLNPKPYTLNRASSRGDGTRLGDPYFEVHGCLEIGLQVGQLLGLG